MAIYAQLPTDAPVYVVPTQYYGESGIWKGKAIPLTEGPLPLPGELDCGPWQISCQEADYIGQSQGPWDFWLDRKPVPSLNIRARRVGDRLTLPGRLGKTVKKWMIEARLPRFQRDVLPVFHCGGRVAAVAGLGPDRAFVPQAGRPAWHITVAALD